MTSNRRPVIGVTGPDHGGLAAWFSTALAIWWAGGRPRRITPNRILAHYALDGLIIGGGADVSPELYGEPPQLTTVLPYKPITVESESRLASVLERTHCRVNSLHRHAISETGEGIRIVAREEAGVVQAIEDSERSFLIGVQ